MQSSTETAGDVPLPGGNFQLFVQKLGYQALLGLGVLENPITRTREVNLGHARTVMDDLLMLREKTAANLTEAEEEHLDQVIEDLEAHFATVSAVSSEQTT